MNEKGVEFHAGFLLLLENFHPKIKKKTYQSKNKYDRIEKKKQEKRQRGKTDACD